MSINKLKVVVSILQEISSYNYPSWTDYGMDMNEFGDIVEAMQDKGLIKDAMIKRGGEGNKILILMIDNAKITIDGMEYLNENSTLMKTYKGLKEIREWLPF